MAGSTAPLAYVDNLVIEADAPMAAVVAAVITALASCCHVLGNHLAGLPAFGAIHLMVGS